MLLKVRAQAQAGLISSTKPNESLDDYGLGGVNCELCGNSGQVHYEKDGFLYSKDCVCMSKRRMLKAARNSGMEDMLSRYTFDAYDPYSEKAAQIKQKAYDFAHGDSGWLYISGTPGSGKSHICVAVCNALIERGKAVKYMLWRDDITRLKANVNDSLYGSEMEKLKTVPVLYIDDFLKGNWTEADIRIAFELLNYRYNDSKLRTPISSELSVSKICEIDEALGSRIYERSKGYVLKSPEENYRLR